MVRAPLTALSLFCLLAGQVHAQEVFAGDQKAKPKYPKAQAIQAKGAKPEAKVATAPPAQASSGNAAAAKKPGSTETAAQQKPESPTPATGTAKASVSQSKLPSAAVPPPGGAAKPHLANLSSIARQIAGVPAKPQAQPPSASAKVAENTKTTGPNIEGTSVKPVTNIATPAEGPTRKVEPKALAKAAAPAASPKPMIAAGKPASAKANKTFPPLTPAERAALEAPSVASTTQPPKTLKSEVKPIPTKPASLIAPKTAPTKSQSMALQTPFTENGLTQATNSGSFETAFTKLADGFDFPVGKPDAQGYYKARGFRSHGHMGEDWDGVGGGDTDLGDPIYSIGDGIVVFARDCHMGWGNVLIVRHSYREGGTVKTIDALYGHLNSMLVHRGQTVSRGQKVATMGTAHGLYDAHLHLEIRKNIEIGMSRAAFAQDFSNYYDPSSFIQTHRHLQTGGGTYKVAMNTFARDARIRWDKVKNYSHAHTGGGTSQSSAALKRALASSKKPAGD